MRAKTGVSICIICRPLLRVFSLIITSSLFSQLVKMVKTPQSEQNALTQIKNGHSIMMNECSFILMSRGSLMARKTNDPIQEQLAQARRDQILTAAARVFAEKGFPRA